MLKRWPAFTRFLNDGRICLSNNAAAERALRPGIALGRRAWLFAGSDRGGDQVLAFMYLALIVTAKMNDIDPQAWLADVLQRLADHPAFRLHELLPWNWRIARQLAAQGRNPSRLISSAGQLPEQRFRAAQLPLPLKTTDLVLPTGSEIRPFS